MSRGPRTRIAEGVYRDAYGLSAVAHAGALSKEKRWPLGTSLATIQRWRQDTTHRMRSCQPRGRRGTLERDVELYISQSHHLASWRELRAELRAWTALYGPWLRSRINTAQVLDARETWRQAGKSPKTINHRVEALRRLYRALDGRQSLTPCDEIAPLEVPRQPVRIVTPATIRSVYLGLLDGERKGALRDSKTRARFMVLASSGVRPSELMRAQPLDVDLERRIWRTRDGKGGVRPGGLYLYDDLLEGWRLFVASHAWGPFETSAFARTLRTAGWPESVRPYCLRHSVGVDLSEGGTDLADVSAWLGHSRPQTTRQHYVPVLSSRMRDAGELLAGRLDWSPPKPTGGTE